MAKTRKATTCVRVCMHTCVCVYEREIASLRGNGVLFTAVSLLFSLPGPYLWYHRIEVKRAPPF